MKKLLCGALVALCASLAQAEEANDTAVLQLLGCNFKEGKNVQNLWAFVDTVRGLVGDPIDEVAGSFVWLPFRSGMGLDFVWGFVNSDLVSMAEASENYRTSGNARIIGPQFEAMAECSSSIVMSELVTAGRIGAGDDREADAIVETFVCTLDGNNDMDDVESATEFWKNQFAKVESEALESYDAWLLRPFRGGRFRMDFGWIGNQPDLRTFMQGSQDFMNSTPGQAALECFESISTCQSALWTGYWVRTPQNRM